jgi:catechol 2,3-dioxygenase-like lactoylglutathione lyase family enzyme
MNIGMVSVFVNNPLEAFKYYTEVLGFVPKMHIPEMYLAIVASPEDPDGTQLLLEPNNNPIASTYQQALYKAGLPPMVFGTKDIQADYQRLKAKGVVFRGEPKKNDFGTDVLFEDTCGNLIQLHENPK